MQYHVQIAANAASPKWAVIIPTYKRYERFFTCLRCLISATTVLGKETQVLVMDNSPIPGLEHSLRSFLSTLPLNLDISYSHSPGLNQAQLRNKAMLSVHPSVENILLMDSDIYLSRDSLAIIAAAFDADQSLAGAAPPMAPYRGGTHENARRESTARLLNDGAGLVMPSPYDYAKGKVSGILMETLMMRGMFAVRRGVLNRVFSKEPWLCSFHLWQNVPFFLSLRERGEKFGYIMDPAGIVLHDERVHRDTLRYSLSSWHAQTIKSIILLFHRNKLWKPEQKALNMAFLDRIKPVLEQHLGLPFTASIGHINQVAELLSMDENAARAKLMSAFESTTNDILKNAIQLLAAEPWRNISAVKSLNISMPM